MAQRQPHLTPHPCICSGLWLAPKLNPASHGTRFAPPLEGRQWLSQPSLGLLCWMRSWYILADDGRYEVWVHLKMASTPTIEPVMIINFGALGMAQDIYPLHACRLSVHLGQWLPNSGNCTILVPMALQRDIWDKLGFMSGFIILHKSLIFEVPVSMVITCDYHQQLLRSAAIHDRRAGNTRLASAVYSMANHGDPLFPGPCVGRPWEDGCERWFLRDQFRWLPGGALECHGLLATHRWTGGTHGQLLSTSERLRTRRPDFCWEQFGLSGLGLEDPSIPIRPYPPRLVN